MTYTRLMIGKPIKPMLCKLAEQPFNDQNYIWEPKLDGARILAVVHDGKARLFGRSGAEKTSLFPDLQIAVTHDCILDGEVISGNSMGGSFNDLQHRVNRLNGIGQAIKDHPARYSIFDILELNQIALVDVPLTKRKEVLAKVVQTTANVSLTPFTTDGVALFQTMKNHQLEGVVGKHTQGFYRENKREWLKVKCWQESSFWAVGYTAGTGWRASTFGALVLSDGKGIYVGSVGTGFTDEDIRNLMKEFSPAPCIFAKPPEPATWIKPFGVMVKFLEYTNDGMLRFPAFKGVLQ